MPAPDLAPPCLIVIFGASGDLTKRKLVPALYDLYAQGRLPEQFGVVGVSRSPMDDQAFRAHLAGFFASESHRFDAAVWARFAKHLHYHAGDSTSLADFEGIKARLRELTEEHQTCDNLLLYLSLAPHLYDVTIENIGQAGLVAPGKRWCSSAACELPPWQRIIVEKPFGSDEASAKHLNRVLGRVFEEEAIYRIDHYLAKETVQNLLAFRFANTIFEPIWNRNYIDHVQVTAAETMGVEGRGGYYDSPSGGAMRDMLQSHLLQIMAVVAMEPPVTLRAEDVRMQKSSVLHAARIPEDRDVPDLAVRGQYGAGTAGGKVFLDYRQEKGVRPDSQTETFASLRVDVDTWRWGGVPFYLRSGKALARKTTEVVVYFKPTPHALFRGKFKGQEGLPPNQILINIQPDEGIRLRFVGKVPGLSMELKPVQMNFDYIEEFKQQPPEAYATLLLEAMRGDQTLYKDRSETERTWQIVQPVLDHWANNPLSMLPNYAAGTWGPAEADSMLAKEGRHWHNR